VVDSGSIASSTHGSFPDWDPESRNGTLDLGPDAYGWGCSVGRLVGEVLVGPGLCEAWRGRSAYGRGCGQPLIGLVEAEVVAFDGEFSGMTDG
jgi:hypothetical protein